MDLSIPQFVLSLLLLGFSYAQRLELKPDKPNAVGKINGGGLLFQCYMKDMAAGEDPALQWFDKSDNVIGVFSSDPTSQQHRIYTKSKGTKLNLVFRDKMLRDGDAGMYTCKGTANGVMQSKGVNLELYEGIQVHSNRTQQPRIYTDAIIECNATGKPMPVMSWSVGPERNPINDPRYKQVKRGLLIKNITKEDNGLFVCELEVITDEHTDTLDFEITVTVTVPPKMKGPATANEAIVGGKFQLSCEADGEPRPNFIFKKEGVVLEGERYKISVDHETFLTRGTLVIEELEDSDEGNYMCVAQNKGGKAENAYFVDTVVPPTIDDIRNQTGAEGSSLILSCVARADPKADVQWHITGTETNIIDDPVMGIEVKTKTEKKPLIHVVNKTLEFKKLKPENTNNYTCTASNNAGSATKVGSVIVEFKPNFENTPYDSTYGWVNHDTEIRCVVDAVPLPSIKWEHKGQVIAKGGNFKIRQEKGTRQLTSILTVIVNIENKSTIFGKYTCVASNMHGETNRTITLQKAVKPNAPVVSIEENDITPTTINLIITPPTQNGGQPVIDYKIVYHKEKDSDNAITRKADVSTDPIEARTQFLIGDLNAKTKYLISVSARNAVGYGTEATVTETTPSIQVPGVPDITSSKQSSAANEYTLTWKTPRSGGSDVTGYNIKYTEVVLKEEDGVQTEDVVDMVGDTTAIRVDVGNDSPPPKTNTYTLTNLKEKANYELQLNAINSVGESMTKTFYFKTSTGGPTTPKLQILGNIDPYKSVHAVTGGGASGGVSATDTNSENGADSVKSGSISMHARLPAYCLLSVLPTIVACILAIAW